MPHAQRPQTTVDEAYSTFTVQKASNLFKWVKLRYPEADVRPLNFDERHGSNRIDIAELATCGYTTKGTEIMLQGIAGTGKSYLGLPARQGGAQAKDQSPMHPYTRPREQAARVAGEDGRLAQARAEAGRFCRTRVGRAASRQPDAGFCDMILGDSWRPGTAPGQRSSAYSTTKRAGTRDSAATSALTPSWTEPSRRHAGRHRRLRHAGEAGWQNSLVA